MNKLLSFLCLYALGSLLWASQVRAASLSLTPATVSVPVGDQTTFTLFLDPQGAAVIGTDIVLTYNPVHISIISVVNLDIFSSNPKTVIDSSAGVLKFSLANNYGLTQTTPSAVATVTVQALSSATETPLSFRFTPGATTDTNVAVAGGLDRLTLVSGSRLTLVPPSQTPAPSPTPTTGPGSTPRPNPSPTLAPRLPLPLLVSPTLAASPSATPAPPPSPSATLKPTASPAGAILGLSQPQTRPPLGWVLALLLYILLIVLVALFLIVRLLRQRRPAISRLQVTSKLLY